MINWRQFYVGDVMARMAIFQNQLAPGALAAGDAFKMLDTIHADLEQQRGGQHAAYSRYAALLRQLQQHDPSLYEQVVARYQATHAEAGAVVADHETVEPTVAGRAARATHAAEASKAKAGGEEEDEDG